MTDKTSKEKNFSCTPILSIKNPNEPILLYKGNCRLHVGKSSFTEESKICLNFFPRPRIEIKMNFSINSNIPPIGPNSNDIYISIRKSPKISVDCIFIQINKGTTLKFTPTNEPIIIQGNKSTRIKSIIFHLYNFIGFIGPKRSRESVTTNSKTVVSIINHLDLFSEDWIIEIRSLPSTSNNLEILKQNGGYGLTHIGTIRKKKNKSYLVKDGQEILEALDYFLSFIKGVKCLPMLCAGYDKDREPVWESWNSPRDSWFDPPLSWFDLTISKELQDIFPGFMNRWKTKSWKKTFTDAIYWYLKSNLPFRGIDVGLILTQAAVERLSFEYAVNERKLISMEGFKKLRASDKLRLLFSSLDISLNIPKEMTSIAKISKIFKWIDAPHALTEIRNSLVHPDHKHQGKYDEVIFEAWNLSLWYLELTMLKLCGYLGTYSNRLNIPKWVGEVENVPWAKE